jgi:hypothetical protein
MGSRYLYDGMPPSPETETENEAAGKQPADMKRVPRGFVVPASSGMPVRNRPAEDQIGVALDERSFESLQRIARYLDIEGANDCTRAELLAKIREALSW